MEKWREQLKKKPVRYWSRIEIEEIIKQYNIDRSRFHEYSKTDYIEIRKKFYYSFFDYKKYPDIILNYAWLRIREKLNKIVLPQYDSDWDRMLDEVKLYFVGQGLDKLFLILSDGWVYEGYIKEIINVLSETDGIIEDFYIVSPRFNIFAVYCSDGDCVVIYEK